MTNTLKGGVDINEGMGPQMAGSILSLDNQNGMGRIQGTDGKICAFSFGLCKSNGDDSSADVFQALKIGDAVTYAILDIKKQEIKAAAGRDVAEHIWVVGNISPNTTLGTDTLVPKTETSVAKVLESTENMGPKVHGVIKVIKLRSGDDKYKSIGFITPTTEGYEKDAFFGVPMCVGGMEAFETLYNAHLTGEQIKVSFHVQDSAQGPTAVNVAIETV